MNSSLSMLSGILDAANANSPTGIIFNMLAEGVFITDSKLSIQYANERFYGLTRLSPQSIDENLRSLLEFNGFSRAEIWKDVLKDGSWNGNIQVSTEGQGEDHELFKIAITTIWDENHQEIYFCVGTIEDITFTKLFHTQRTASPEIILTEAQFQEKLGQSIQHKRKSDQAKKMGLLFISVEHSLYGVISNEEIHNIIGLAIRQLALECRDEDIIGYSSESTVFILLTNITEIQHLPGKAERIAKGLVKPIYSKNGTAINLSVCMGISIYPDDSEKTETLIRYSQLAAVRAKSTDKSWAIFSSEMESLIIEKFALENALRESVSKGFVGFSLVAQPQLDLSRGTTNGVEMLLRYNHPVLGSISPVKFIPILEETHLIDLVGTWVLEESCLVGRLWELSNQPLFIGVNISMLQLDSPDFVSLVANTLKKTKLSPQLLELEITESMIMQNIDSTIAKLTLLRSLGVRIAIDDFGTGYSSLASLKYLPITRLKIDQSFIKNLETSSDDLAMIQTIISLAKNLSICAIAEGGETAYQLDVLRINGCQEMQGFYHSRPIPVSNVLSFVRNEQRLSLQ